MVFIWAREGSLEDPLCGEPPASLSLAPCQAKESWREGQCSLSTKADAALSYFSLSFMERLSTKLR